MIPMPTNAPTKNDTKSKRSSTWISLVKIPRITKNDIKDKSNDKGKRKKNTYESLIEIEKIKKTNQ